MVNRLQLINKSSVYLIDLQTMEESEVDLH